MHRLVRMALTLGMLGLLAGAIAPVASARPGQPAKSFGGNGVIRLNGLVEEPGHMAIGPGGKVLVLGSDDCDGECDAELAVTRFDLDGGIDAGYGEAGTARTGISTEREEIPVRADEAALAVDARGGALVAAHRGQDGKAVAIRLDGEGEADDSFGENGTVDLPDYGEKTFGDTALGEPADLSLELAHGGFFVFATWLHEEHSGPPRYRRLTEAHVSVSKYTADGESVSGFGSGGEALVGLPGVETVAAVAERRFPGVVLFGTTCCEWRLPVAARLTGRGRLDPRFGGSGRWRGLGGIRAASQFLSTAAIARRNGKVDIFGAIWWRSGRDTGGFDVRLRARGKAFGRFGPRHGVRFSPNPVTDAVLDPRGRTLIASRSGGNSGGDVTLHRLLPGGRLDRRFGHKGTALATKSASRQGTIEVGISRGRAILFSEAYGTCSPRLGLCEEAEPTLEAYQDGSYRRRARH